MYTGFLGGAVRERGLLPLEEAVAILTGRPAALYGLTDRGILAPGDVGRRGDLRSGRDRARAGARRLFCKPLGIWTVLVNRVRTVADGRLTGASAGSDDPVRTRHPTPMP